MLKPYVIPFMCLFILSGVLSACSGGGKVQPSVPAEPFYRIAAHADMTTSYLAAGSNEFSVLCPKGWQETVDKKNAPAIILWLVKEDYSASLSFNPMKMDPALYRTLQKDGLTAVAKVSLSMKKANAKDTVTILQPVEAFVLKKRSYAAYEYTSDGGKTAIRVVIFDSGKQFYECTLLPATSSITQADQQRLFETQQAVLQSMSLK